MRRGGTVGPALPGVELRIVDDAGCDVPVGEIGGIVVRGPNVFRGYWNLPDKTREEFTRTVFQDRRCRRRDADGYVTIVGRSKDLIISGGYNVSSRGRRCDQRAAGWLKVPWWGFRMLILAKWAWRLS